LFSPARGGKSTGRLTVGAAVSIFDFFGCVEAELVLLQYEKPFQRSLNTLEFGGAQEFQLEVAVGDGQT